MILPIYFTGLSSALGEEVCVAQPVVSDSITASSRDGFW